MDFYNFIDSVDIKEHLRKLNYQFTVPEAAYLVYHNDTITLEEKFSAWQWIIDHMPDCSMEERLNMMKISSFHEFLKSYMGLQKRSIERFYAKDSAVYFYYYECRGEQYFFNDYLQAFSSIETCLEDCKKEIAEESSGIVSISMKKQWLDAPEKNEKTIQLCMNERMQPVAVDENYLLDDEVDTCIAFERMWFDFPTPFKRGDILCEERGRYKNIIVLNSLNTWTSADMLERGFHKGERGVERADEIVERFNKNGDISDMGGSYYGVASTDGGCYVKAAPCQLYFETFNDYLSLSYYKKPLKGAEHLLVAVSELLKGEWNITEVIDAYMTISAQKTIKDICSMYLPEWPVELGIY